MSIGFLGTRTGSLRTLPPFFGGERQASTTEPSLIRPKMRDDPAMSSDAEGEGLALELPRIRLFNVKYSPNLGDGLLSECLEKALIMLGASPDTWSIDLAARQAYGDTLPGRTQIMSMLDMLPNGLRQQFVRLPLAMQARRKWRPHYSSCLRGATAVVIGGGNLISDIDLNFPTKLSLAVEEAARLSLPFVVYASGVTSHWTRRGVSMLEKTFASRLLRGVFVRDHDSKLLWDAQLGQVSGFQASVVRDPALLVSQFIAPSRIHDARPPVAGVGIMSHIAIRYHASNAPDTQHLETWYAELVRELVRKGFRVAIFTNGSPEDVVYLARLRPRLLTAGGKAVCFPVQRTPTELCAIISSLDVLVAYRMHAVIAAYSYGVPAIGLAWDRKLRSFMSSVGCEEFLCDVAEVSPTAAADLACQAAAAGIAEEDRTQVMREAWQGISQLINLIGRVP